MRERSLERLAGKLALLALLASATLSAQIRIPVWASGPDGRPRTKLAASDLSAWVQDRKVTVMDVRRPGDPLVLLLVMDTVGDLNRIDAARRVPAEHIGSMGEEWHVALLQAQDGLRVVVDPTNNRRQLIEQLNALPVSGFPGLLDSVIEAATVANSIMLRSAVRAAVLYITDGRLEDYRGDYAAAVVNPSDRSDLSRRFRDRLVQERIATTVRALGASAPPLFFVHLEERSSSLDVAYQNGIRQFASETAGEAYFVRGLSEVGVNVRRALERIDLAYNVKLEEPDDLSGALRIRLEAAGPVRLTYRETFDAGQRQKGEGKRKSKRKGQR
jgi:Mg-chelatase subunit ChlD